MDLNLVKEQAQQMQGAGAESKEIVLMLRSSGVSKTISIMVLAELGMPLARAKEVVHNSQAWADTREADEKFSATVESVLETLGTTSEDD